MNIRCRLGWHSYGTYYDYPDYTPKNYRITYNNRKEHKICVDCGKEK